MKKIFFGVFLASIICLLTVPVTFARTGKCIIATDFDGYKFMVLIGKQVLVREKTLKETRLNDYKGYKIADTFEDETPINITMSGNGVVAYVSTIADKDDDNEESDNNGTEISNVYRYEKGKRSPEQPIWQFNGKINGLATNMNGGKLLAITESKKLVYRSKDGNFRIIRTCAGVPTSIAMSTDGNFVFVVTGKNQLNKYSYDSTNDTYEYDNKGLWDKEDAILGVSSNMDATKVWLVTCKPYGWKYALVEGNKEGDFRKLYDFDDTSRPWNVALSGNSMMAYIPLNFSWIYRLTYDSEAKCYVVYKLHY